MLFNNSIFSFSHLLKTVLGHLTYFFFKPKDGLFVLNFHSTPKKYNPNFESIISFLKKDYSIIDYNFFKTLLANEKSIKGRYVMFTFDDGLKNNINALKILNQHQISSLLFIVPAFIDSNKQKEFYLKNIRPTINPNIDSEIEDFIPLSWDELELIKQQHFIGCHTYSHTLTTDEKLDSILEKEIIYSKSYIERKLNITVDSYCSINNTLNSTNKQAKTLIENNYTYHFTTFGGDNVKEKKSLLLQRINIETFWLKGAIKFSLSRLNLSRWKKVIEKYKKL